MCRITFIFSFLAFFLFANTDLLGQRPKKKFDADDTPATEVICLGAGMPGNIRLKVWSYGKTVEAAIESAKWHAVDAVLFKGTGAGTAGCPSNPIITDGTVRETKEDYFKEFFEIKAGKYLQFVTISRDGTIPAEDRIKVGKNYKVGVYLILNHKRLREQMETDNIIKKFGSGFQ